MQAVLTDLATEANMLANPHEPWNSPHAALWDSKSLGDWLDNKKMTPLCRQALEIEFSNNNGAITHEQSLLFNLAIIKGGGCNNHWDNVEMFKCARGNEALAHSLEHAIRAKGGQLRRKTPVRKIEIDERKGVNIEAGRSTKESFNYVVLAIPPTTWDRIDFSPSRPLNRDVTMGTAVKFLNSMRDRFWIDNRRAPSSASDEYGMTWEGTDNQTQKRNDTVALSLFSGGPIALQASKGGSALQYFIKPLENVYPLYRKYRLKSVFVNWPRETWIRCGYSCLKPTEVTTKAQNLAHPFLSRLYFAGEHTCPAFYGYMEGALYSGYRVAKEIMQCP